MTIGDQAIEILTQLTIDLVGRWLKAFTVLDKVPIDLIRIRFRIHDVRQT